MTRVALFGTSADPPTAGHQAILKWLSERYDVVAVWASDNPFKDHQTSLKHRKAMLWLIIEDIDAPKQNVMLREELGYTRSLYSIEKAREIWGENAQYTLVIGSDLAGQIRSWYRIEELLQKVQILIVPRPGYSIKDEDIEALRSLGGSCKIADLEVPAVSSTAYRREGDSNAVTQSVADYIEQEQLYA